MKHPLIFIGGAAVGAYAIGWKKLGIGIGALTALLYFDVFDKDIPTDQMKAQLLSWSQSSSPEVQDKRFTSIVNQFSKAEIKTVYKFIFQYYLQDKMNQIPPGLANELRVISAKYNIFT